MPSTPAAAPVATEHRGLSMDGMRFTDDNVNLLARKMLLYIVRVSVNNLLTNGAHCITT